MVAYHHLSFNNQCVIAQLGLGNFKQSLINIISFRSSHNPGHDTKGSMKAR